MYRSLAMLGLGTVLLAAPATAQVPKWVVTGRVDKKPLAAGACSYVSLYVRLPSGKSIPLPDGSGSVGQEQMEVSLVGAAATQFKWGRNTPGSQYLCATTLDSVEGQLLVRYPRKDTDPNKLRPNVAFEGLLSVWAGGEGDAVTPPYDTLQLVPVGTAVGTSVAAGAASRPPSTTASNSSGSTTSAPAPAAARPAGGSAPSAAPAPVTSAAPPPPPSASGTPGIVTGGSSSPTSIGGAAPASSAATGQSASASTATTGRAAAAAGITRGGPITRNTPTTTASTGPLAPTPVAPGNPAGAYGGSGEVVLTWTASPGATGYRIQRFGNAAGDAQDITPAPLAATVVTYRDNGPPLVDGLAYLITALYANGQTADAELVKPTGLGWPVIRKYLATIPQYSFVPGAFRQEPTNQTITIANAQQQAKVQVARYTNPVTRLLMLWPNASALTPGAMLQGKSLAGNQYATVDLPRAGGVLELIGIASKGVETKRSVTLADARGNLVNAAKDNLLGGLVPVGSSGSIDFKYSVVRTVSSGLTKLGMAFNYGDIVKVDANMTDERSAETTTILVSFTQVFYTATFSRLEGQGFFAPSVTLNDVQKVTGPNNPLVFVSQVDYGRMMVFALTTQKERTSFEAAVNAAVTYGKINGKLNVSTAQKNALDGVQVTVFERGSTGVAASALAQAQGPDSTVTGNALDIINAYIKNGAEFSTSNPGLPIAIQTSYLTNATAGETSEPATIGLITEYKDILSVDSVCASDVDVWDGSMISTGLRVRRGDVVTTTLMAGRAWSPVFGDGGWDAQGWYNWNEPGRTFAERTAYPIWNRSPFGLIARVGTNELKGYVWPKRGWDPVPAANAEERDWSSSIWLGQNKKEFTYAPAEELEKIPGDLQSTVRPNEGEFFLSTNSDFRKDAPANERLRIRTCVRRSLSGVGTT